MSPTTPGAVRLIPLLCVECRAPVPAQINEVAWVCEQCGKGLILDPAQGTAPLAVFFSSTITPGSRGRPFWVSRGQVVIHKRETYRGDEGRKAREFWAEPRLFYIPAWDCPLGEVLELGKVLLKNPVGIEPGPRAAFLPVVTLPSDMKALGEFLVMSIEAERSDHLRSVDFQLRLEPPQLWVLK